MGRRVIRTVGLLLAALLILFAVTACENIGFMTTIASIVDLYSTSLQLFWVDSDVVRGARLDGTDVRDLVTGVGGAHHVTACAATRRIYFNRMSTPSVDSADLDGKNVVHLVTGLSDPQGIAIDTINGKIYWADIGDNTVGRANLADGSNKQNVTPVGMSMPSDIVLDAAAGKMYVVDSITRKIVRANLDGSSPGDLLTMPGAPIGIAIDVAGGKIYWSEFSNFDVRRANLSDGLGEESVISTGGIGMIALDTSAGKIYYRDSDKIRRANLDGTSQKTVVSGGGSIAGIAVLP